MIGDSTIKISGDTDRVLVIQTKKKRYPKGVPDWVAVFQTNDAIAIIKQLKGVSSQVLLFMQQITKVDNHVGYNQKSIADILGISESSVARAIKQLTILGVITPYRDKPVDSINGDGRRNNYILNPEMHWKGYHENRQKMIKEMYNPNHKNQLKLYTIQ